MTKALIAILLLAPAAVQATEVSIEIKLGVQTDFERHVVTYDCSGGARFAVTYINAAPNFLALVPIADEPEPRIFASVISASGARYAAGQWMWWSTGVDANLYDVTLGDDSEPVLTCSELNNTP